jgi:hypothetical protein
VYADILPSVTYPYIFPCVVSATLGLEEFTVIGTVPRHHDDLFAHVTFAAPALPHRRLFAAPAAVRGDATEIPGGHAAGGALRRHGARIIVAGAGNVVDRARVEAALELWSQRSGIDLVTAAVWLPADRPANGGVASSTGTTRLIHQTPSRLRMNRHGTGHGRLSVPVLPFEIKNDRV